MPDFSEMAERVQLECESYSLRHSIDGRRRVLADALRAAHNLGLSTQPERNLTTERALAQRDARIAETEEHLARKSEAMAALSDRLQTIVDEQVSSEPVLPADTLVTIIERHIASTTPQKRHRERAAQVLTPAALITDERLQQWIATGEWVGAFTDSAFTRLAQSFAELEAETRAEENQLRRQRLNTIAIPLPECSVAHNRLVRVGTSERLLRGTEDLERGVLSGRHGARFRPTLVLEPVENERSGG